jgi:hypothetical protein
MGKEDGSGQVDAAFRDTPQEFLESIHKAIQESIAAAEAMDEFLTRRSATAARRIGRR